MASCVSRKSRLIFFFVKIKRMLSSFLRARVPIQIEDTYNYEPVKNQEGKQMKDQRGRAVMKKTDQIIKTQVKLGQKKWFDPRPCQYVPGPRLNSFLQTNSSDEPTDQDLWANYYNGITNILIT